MRLFNIDILSLCRLPCGSLSLSVRPKARHLRSRGVRSKYSQHLPLHAGGWLEVGRLQTIGLKLADTVGGGGGQGSRKKRYQCNYYNLCKLWTRHLSASEGRKKNSWYSLHLCRTKYPDSWLPWVKGGPTMNYIFIKLVRMVLEPNSLLLPYQKDETRKVTIVKPL